MSVVGIDDFSKYLLAAAMYGRGMFRDAVNSLVRTGLQTSFGNLNTNGTGHSGSHGGRGGYTSSFGGNSGQPTRSGEGAT